MQVATPPPLTLQDKVQALHRSETYSAGQCAVTAIETHFSWVFFVGEFAYKLKKPVQIERMDFSALAAREQSCREELRLNRRLAPEIYLGVAVLVRSASGELQTKDAPNSGDEALEWLVRMRRLPEQRLLNNAIRDGRVTVADTVRIAERLAEFYRAQSPITLTAATYVTRVRSQVEETQQQLAAADLRLDGELLVACTRQQHALLDECAMALGARAAHGKVVEGHGDLRPEHVFLGSSAGNSFGSRALAPCVIDCLEFDRDLRIFDPYEELAFLWLECERLQAAWVGREITRAYRSLTQDSVDVAVFGFYRAQRALTRAKIAAWHVRDPDVRDLADWHALASSYLQQALKPAQIVD